MVRNLFGSAQAAHRDRCQDGLRCRCTRPVDTFKQRRGDGSGPDGIDGDAITGQLKDQCARRPVHSRFAGRLGHALRLPQGNAACLELPLM